MHTLIADSGSTKTQWRLIDESGQTADEFFTPGVNPSVMPAAQADTAICSALRKRRLSPARIYYYGAGCTAERKFVVENALRKVYPQAEAIAVESDLLAAVRALCGNAEGIACILGTGMASCLCSGGAIVSQTPSLGYVLGDEGSGAVLGRIFLGALLKGALPHTVREAWQSEYNMSAAEVIERVYREPQPNRFLASFAPFILQHTTDEQVHQLVAGEFRRFFCRNIVPYGRKDLPVNFVGSVATHFLPLLREAAEAEGFEIGGVLQTPMDALVRYHATH